MPTRKAALHQVTEQNIEEILANAGDKAVLIEFRAEWCQPNQYQLPVLQEMARELRSYAIIGQVDIDKNPELAKRLNVTGIPYFIAYRNREEIGRMNNGLQTKHRLKKLIGAEKVLDAG